MAKRALILEGGGSKTAYGHGVLCAAEDAGIMPWHTVYGNSLGGALAAWHGAGQANYAVDTWECMQDRRFVSYRKLLLGRPFLDQEAIVDEVYVTERPLDLQALSKAKQSIRVVASNADTGAAVYPDIRTGPTLQWLKATMRLPLGSNGPVVIDGQRYLDGGCLDSIPLQRAIDDGNKRIDLVLNQPPGIAQRDAKWLTERAARRYPALAEGLRNHVARKEAAWHLARHPPKGVQVQVWHPPHPTGLRRISRDVAAIRAVLEQGRQDAAAWLETGQL